MDSGVYRKWIEDIDALSEAQREEVAKNPGRSIVGGRSDRCS